MANTRAISGRNNATGTPRSRKYDMQQGKRGESAPKRYVRSRTYAMPPERPWPVTAIVVLDIIGVLVAGFLLVVILGALKDLNQAYQSIGYNGFSSAKFMLTAFVYLLPIGMALQTLVALGLWRLKNWARITTIVFGGLNIAGSIYGLASHGLTSGGNATSYLVSLVYACTVLGVLSRPSVVKAFQYYR